MIDANPIKPWQRSLPFNAPPRTSAAPPGPADGAGLLVLSDVDLWFARQRQAVRPSAPAAHESLALARRRGLRRPASLYGTALRFNTWFRVGPSADPLWSEAEVLYRPGSLTQSICRIREGRDRCELRLDHHPDDGLLDTDCGSLDLRLSADFGRVLFRLEADCAAARAAARVILAGDYGGWSLQNVPREFRQVGFRKFVIDRADVLELSAVGQACCPGCPIKAEAAPPRRRPPPGPARAASADAPPRRILTAGKRCSITAARAGGNKKLPTFTGVAYSGAPMRPMGWFHDVVIDLTGVEVPSAQRPVLRQHDHLQICGHSTRVRVTSKGILVEGVFSGQPEHVDKVVVPALRGFPWQLSVGADPIKTEFLEPGEEETVNGLKVSGPLTISRETVLKEISFVPLGADEDTSADVAAATRGSALRGVAAEVAAEFVARMRAEAVAELRRGRPLACV